MLSSFIERYHALFTHLPYEFPWQVTDNLHEIIINIIKTLKDDYEIKNDIAIHRTAAVEQNVVLKGPVIIAANSFIGANSYVRGPVYFDENVRIGAGCEIKQSIIFSDTAVAHFNYIGNSMIGSRVNFEAGSVAANHFNERKDKQIHVSYNGKIMPTGVFKFGSLVGDDARIGANAVLSPGTLLQPASVVARLELIEQVKI